jgi:hypothetical protein
LALLLLIRSSHPPAAAAFRDLKTMADPVYYQWLLRIGPIS